MYCSRSLSVTESIMMLANNRKKDVDLDISFYETGLEKEDEEDEEDWDFESYVNQNSPQTSSVNQADNNINKHLDIEMNSLPSIQFEGEKVDQEDWVIKDFEKLKIIDENVENANVMVENENSSENTICKTSSNCNEENQNSPIIQITAVISKEENKITEELNFNKHMIDDKVNNNGDVLQDDLHLFNSNVYWYISPDMPLDPSIIAGKESSGDLNSSEVSTMFFFFLFHFTQKF